MSGPGQEYRRLLRELDRLFSVGAAESPEADAVRNLMDQVWIEMPPEERFLAREEWRRPSSLR